MYQPANWETRAARYRRFHWRNESARDLTCCRKCVISFSLQVAEANGRPPRNFGQWPTAQRWPTAPYQQATEFKPPQQVPSGKPPGQDIFRRQQTTGQQQLPPKGYTGSRVVQPTTTKQLIRTVGPTGATAMTVAVPQPPAIGEQLPAAVAEPPLAAAEIPPVAVPQPPAAVQQPAVAVPHAAAVVATFHPMVAAERPPFIAQPMAAAWPSSHLSCGRRPSPGCQQWTRITASGSNSLSGNISP